MTGRSLHRLDISQHFTPCCSLWRGLSAPCNIRLPGYWNTFCMKWEDCKPVEMREFELTYHISPSLTPDQVWWAAQVSLNMRGKLIISRKQPGLSWADSLAFWRNNSFFTAAEWTKIRSDVVRRGVSKCLIYSSRFVTVSWWRWPGSGWRVTGSDNQIFMATEIMSQNISASDTELLRGGDLSDVNNNGQFENRRCGEIRQKLTRWG